jgi:hypothetical protein
MLEKMINTTIKAVHETQGIKHVEVRSESYTHAVPVYVKVRNMRMKSTELKFYRGLGLLV